MRRFENILLWDASDSAYIDLTSNTLTNADFNFLSNDDADQSYMYFGSSCRFVGIYCDLTTNGSYTGLQYEYWDGENWLKLALIDNYAFDQSKYVRWELPKSNWAKQEFSTTFPHTVSTSPETTERYWVRIYCSAVTTTAVIHKIRAIPYASYTSPTKVCQFMNLKISDFDYQTKPTDLTVEDLIRRGEDRIDYQTKKSWRFNAITEDYDPVLVDYNRYGVYFRHRNFTKVYSVKLWNGGEFQTLTEGRNSDYFVNYNNGIVYFTRLFLLPAAYGMTGRYFHFGYGEYKNSVQIDYVYGRDSETDTEFRMVEDIATKIAAKDIYQTYDMTGLIISGADKVPLDSKVRLLEEEIESKIDLLSGVFLT
jgi:hypothetical protein